MKFLCDCGNCIIAQTDYLNNKGYIIPDKNWFDILDSIENAVKNNNITNDKKESVFEDLQKIIIGSSKTIYQCNSCGNIFIENNNGSYEMFTNNTSFNDKSILDSKFITNK